MSCKRSMNKIFAFADMSNVDQKWLYFLKYAYFPNRHRHPVATMFSCPWKYLYREKKNVPWPLDGTGDHETAHIGGSTAIFFLIAWVFLTSIQRMLYT